MRTKECSHGRSKLLLAMFLVLINASACSVTTNVYRSHTLMFSGEGQPLHIDSHPVGKPPIVTKEIKTDCFIEGRLSFSAGIQREEKVRAKVGSPRTALPGRYFQVETCQEYQDHIDQIFSGLIASKKNKVMIYIHGGLNDTAQTLEREAALLACDEEDGADHRDCIESDFYPIFINWSSSLTSSYRDHLFRIRQGQVKPKVAKLTSPFIFAEDMISAMASLPSAVTEDIADGSNAKNDYAWAAAIDKYEKDELGIDAYIGQDHRSHARKIIDAVNWFPVGLLNVVTTPMVQGLGQPAWQILTRRTSILFDKERLPRFPGEDAATGDGPLSPFFRSMLKFQSENPNVELTIVGHSMGVIVLNNALRHFRKIRYKNIVYMAAACSLDDYQDTIFPYLNDNPQTEMFHLTLQERAEILERHWRWFEVSPRGSLLVWIDNFLEDPRYRLDRTAGRIFNLLREVNRTPNQLKGRIHIKSFDFGPGKALSACNPQVHGALDDLPFWKTDYWLPATGGPICAPATHEGSDAPPPQ